MQEQPKTKHIVIIGAGFGGIRAVRALSKADVRITLIDKHNYHLFQPLLYQVSTATLSIDDIAYPVRAMIKQQKNVHFRMGEVNTIDFERKSVILATAAVAYDYLIIATGGVTNYFGLKAVEKNSFGMKNLDESVTIRNHILHQFELAAYEQDRDKRRARLTFIIVGGGPTGVESAGALSELIYLVMAREYHTLNFKEVRIVLVEASDKVLAAMPAELQETTVETLIRKHVEVRLCVQVTDYDGERLSLKGGEVIPTRTVIWAAGIKAAPLLDTLHIEQDQARRAVVNEFLQLPAHPDVFVIGDAAHYEYAGRPLPMIAPVAIQQADVAAKNIKQLMAEKPLEKFTYKDVGSMATIGRNAAVVHMGHLKLKGVAAWLIWSLVHILRLIDFRNRFVVFMKWVWEYMFYDRLVRIITRQ
ncbi:NAD(P)/FAD-dependent oxidoreductase [Sporomusa termitida]|uniref:NADH:ubiquinone reductase (non-electrogenic) n=1 Tax=Sporomusa termitida TaxID=2377 RepID=A0A517DYF6_9FIRM|nr:NAD(P)/FAD-dependent oxidoreductase [Sporomusa termitida]QDR82372.1 NADH dehydrogenase-like protein YjlD [Sporomusa termitida]